MLRLVKARGKEIHVKLRNREKWFSPLLVRAFVIASLFHLLALALFRIHSMFNTQEYFLPPSIVETDGGPIDDVVAYMEEPGKKRYFFAPAPSRLTLPEMPSPQFVREVESIKAGDLSHNPFVHIETGYDFINFDPPITSPKGIQIHVSGELARVPLLEPAHVLVDKLSKELKPVSNSKIVYTVQVESRTGKIFWYMPEKRTAVKEAQQFGDKIVSLIRFKPNRNAFVYTGAIEIILGNHD